jgi:hypothetical protein
MDQPLAFRLQRVDEILLALRIDGTHPPHVSLEMPVADEVREHHLLERRLLRPTNRRAAAMAGRSDGGAMTKPMRSAGNITLLNVPTYTDASCRVEPLQRRERAAHVAELAVVVVFDDPCLHVRRGREELQPPRQRHRDPERELMRRGDVHEACVRCTPATGNDTHTVRVHRHAGHAQPGRRERA